MAAVRVCLFLVLIICVDNISSKPIFQFLLCDFFCDDDDRSTSTSTTSSSEDDYFDCEVCFPRRRRTTTTASPIIIANGGANPMSSQGITILTNGQRIQLNGDGGTWGMTFTSGNATPSPQTAMSGNAPAPAAGSGAVTTAAPDATTAAATEAPAAA